MHRAPDAQQPEFRELEKHKTVAFDLKQVYHAATAEEAERQLVEFEARLDARYPSIAKIWRRHSAGVGGLFSFPEEIRKAIYTTNVVESLNMTLRKVIKTRASFPNEESALKLIYLALKNVSQRWRSAPSWRTSLNHFMSMGRSDRSCSTASHPIK